MEGISRQLTKSKQYAVGSYDYRIMVGIYAGEIEGDRKNIRIFPSIKKNVMTTFFSKLRLRYGEKEKWLLDVYQIEKGFNFNHELLWEVPRYMVASHACRANYCTKAHEVSQGDYIQGQKLSGHRDVVDYARYVKYSDIKEKKVEIKERFMDNLSVPTLPQLKGQKKLEKYLIFA